MYRGIFRRIQVYIGVSGGSGVEETPEPEKIWRSTLAVIPGGQLRRSTLAVGSASQLEGNSVLRPNVGIRWRSTPAVGSGGQLHRSHLCCRQASTRTAHAGPKPRTQTHTPTHETVDLALDEVAASNQPRCALRGYDTIVRYRGWRNAIAAHEGLMRTKV